MKTIKFVFPLALVLTLASCGSAKSVTRADAEKLLQDSSTAVTADGYTFPTKFTLTSTVEASGQSSSAMNVSIKSTAAYDEKSQYYHLSADVLGTELWAYVKDDKFISATSVSKGGVALKLYTKADASGWKKDSSVSAMMGQAKDAQTSALSTTLSMVKSFDDGSASSASGETYEVNESYTSSGAGNLTLTLDAKHTSGSYSSGAKVEFSMDNNLFNRFYMEASEGSSITKSEKKIDWNSCDLSYPDLTQFSQTL